MTGLRYSFGGLMFEVKAQHTRIVSSTPGRTRVKVSEKRRTQEEMGRLAKTLRERLSAADAQINLLTGSIVLQHPQNNLEDVCSVLKDLGVILIGLTDSGAVWAGGRTRAASEITGAVSRLNRWFGDATNGMVNLQLLLPFGLGVLALRQLLRYGWQIESAPWYVLAYAAFDSFIKLHYTRDRDRVMESTEEDAGSVH
jgi:hypothetical protein